MAEPPVAERIARHCNFRPRNLLPRNLLPRNLLLGGVLLLAGAGFAGEALLRLVPLARWWPVLWRPNPAQLADILAADAVLPRLAVALLCGAALGLSGALAQVALRNPLAAPDTLGVSAGAQLALSAATLYAPNLLAGLGRGMVAAAGGAAGLAIVLALTLRGGLRPAAVALAGLAVALYLQSAGGMLAVLNTRQLAGMFVWNAGSLVQLGWAGVAAVLPAVLAGAAIVVMLRRPLRLLELPDGLARGLGVAVAPVRLAALAVSVALAAAVSGAVGTVGFLGLLAPSLARAAGGASLFVAAPLMGAGLLAAADGVVSRVTDGLAIPVPTGAVTALAGLPLLLWLLARGVPAGPGVPVLPPASAGVPRRVRRPGLVLLATAGAAAALAVGALLVGPGLGGWSVGLLPVGERAPRAAAAALAGLLLGVSGTLLQRVLDNAMASPEVLGLGTGTTAGAALALFLGHPGTLARGLAGLAGTAVVLLILLPFGRGPGGPSRLPVAGIALSASAAGGMALLLASGDPRAETVLAWLSGSTYGIGMDAVAVAALAGLVALLPVLALLRPLDLLSLGAVGARAQGLRVGGARTGLLAVAAALAAVATLLVGPLSFAGLMAPHLARLLGFTRPAGQVAGAALAGAAVMLAADWFGRVALFPYEIPAGLAASLLGGPVLVFALARENRR